MTTITYVQVGRNDRGWKQWFDKDAPEEAQIPDGYHISLDSFRKLLLIRYKTGHKKTHTSVHALLMLARLT